MDKRFAAILVACIAILGIVFFVTQDKSSAPANNSSSAKLSNHTLGNNKKNVSLVEYGDFQCPACASYHPIIKQLIEKYKEDIVFQFRNFPLSQIHQNARAASRAAEAAAKQNKYWEMHDKLYEQQQEWESSTAIVSILEGYAKELTLNIDQFKTDYASTEVNDIINADYAEGQKLGVQGTPTFFLQGKKIEDTPRDLDSFGKLIESEINKKQ